MTGTIRSAGPHTGLWELQTTLSSADFAVRELGVGTVHGQVPIREASVEVDRTGRFAAVRAVLDLAHLDTGNARRDLDLGKPRLLDTAKYPDLTYAGRSVEDEAGTWRVEGEVAACGGQTAVTLTATTTERDGSITVHATGEFDRRALGVRAPRLLIGRRVRVTIDAVFTPTG